MDDKEAISELQRYSDWPPTEVKAHAVQAIRQRAWFLVREAHIETMLSGVGPTDTWGRPTGRSEYEEWLKENPKP